MSNICKDINRLSNKELALLGIKLLQARMQMVSEIHVKSFIAIVRALCKKQFQGSKNL